MHIYHDGSEIPNELPQGYRTWIENAKCSLYDDWPPEQGFPSDQETVIEFCTSFSGDLDCRIIEDPFDKIIEQDSIRLTVDMSGRFSVWFVTTSEWPTLGYASISAYQKIQTFDEFEPTYFYAKNIVNQLQGKKLIYLTHYKRYNPPLYVKESI